MEAIFQFDFDDLDAPPPEYTSLGNDPHIVTRQPHHYHLPSFEEVMVLYEYEDSIRLPTYQARPIRRYHPYWRIRPNPPLENRYYNTIYDEEMVELNVPAREAPSDHRDPTPHDTVTATQGPTGPVNRLEIPPIPQGPPPLPPVAVPLRAAVPAPVPPEDDPLDLDLEAQRRRRMHRLWHLIPEFVTTVMEALEAASQAMGRPAGAITPVLVPAPAAAEELPTSAPTSPPASSTQGASSTLNLTSTLPPTDGQPDN